MEITFENDGVVFRIEVMGKFVRSREWLVCLYRTNLVKNTTDPLLLC
jgi:hypothetical protein